jgi:glycosyltransferase involved in cell wall biosynthesis
MRADWLSQKFRFPRKKISVVYNTSFGDYLPQKSRHFRDKFKIPDEKKAVLAVGSLIQEHMILEIVQSVAQWPQEFALVIHGWFPDKVYEEKIRTVAERSPGCIFISTEFLPLDRKYEVFQSADIGLVAFTPDNDNNLFVGAAAGKLFEFLRCGVPAVVNELNGMRELIGGKCGEVCGSHLENIGYLLSKVDGQYAHYTDECRKFYANYGFAGCYKKFLTDFYQGEQGG